jgi:hypothetical protein
MIDDEEDETLDYLLNKFEVSQNGLPGMGDLRTTKETFRDSLLEWTHKREKQAMLRQRAFDEKLLTTDTQVITTASERPDTETEGGQNVNKEGENL